MKRLLLALALVASSESWAALKCKSFLKKQTETAPIARISFTNNDKLSHTITFSRDKTMLNLDFTKSFLTGLSSFFAGKSTTTSRLEERSVMKESDSKALLEESNLTWVPRDQKKEGEDFTTVTTYSGKFIMDSDTDFEVSAKLRARKYFSHDVGQTKTTKMQSVFGNVGSLEIKISNVAGVDADGFTAFPNSVFKPRVFIGDDTLKKISKMDHQKLSDADTREKVIEELFFLEVSGKQMNQDLSQIESFVDSLILLLGKNPNLFEVQTVVAYNRDSYSASVDVDTEYQYTLDRNIRIYEPDSSLSAENIVEYLNHTPLHKVEEGVAFAELKSPITEKTSGTPTYQALSNALFSKHRVNFAEGKGKHSLGSQVRSKVAQTTLSEQLYTEGLLFYLIKGVGNLPKPPNRKHLVELGTWEIAMPLTINGSDHRIIFGYERNTDNGIKTEVLNSIRLVDFLGRKVSLDSNGVKEIISTALQSSDPSTITIDNQAISFPTVIKQDIVDSFTDFFDRFYTGYGKGQANPREIESLHIVNNRTRLDSYIKRMKVGNFMAWLKDRVFKHAPQVVFTAAFFATSTIVLKMTAESSNANYPATQQTQDQGVVTLINDDESYNTGLVGVVLPDGRVKILSVEPLVTEAPGSTIDINSDVLGEVQVSIDDSAKQETVFKRKQIK